MYSAAPPSAVAFRGNGENIIYIDWTRHRGCRPLGPQCEWIHNAADGCH